MRPSASLAFFPSKRWTGYYLFSHEDSLKVSVVSRAPGVQSGSAHLSTGGGFLKSVTGETSRRFSHHDTRSSGVGFPRFALPCLRHPLSRMVASGPEQDKSGRQIQPAIETREFLRAPNPVGFLICGVLCVLRSRLRRPASPPSIASRPIVLGARSVAESSLRHL